ncbi:hypothetical protein Hamer_G016415 [Homarus americanus]|uniref:Uncharacterized protein n=1 Tax=Homarus americanus TaxID=6706 RepID=A0A8J5N795_HOMAM|nr:hypothetical protein Hamer_G016415 [Homarus americanus]
METVLTSLRSRKERLAARFTTKFITRARESVIKNEVLRALNLNREVFDKITRLLCAADTVNRLGLKKIILSKGPDTMSPARLQYSSTVRVTAISLQHSTTWDKKG